MITKEKIIFISIAIAIFILSIGLTLLISYLLPIVSGIAGFIFGTIGALIIIYIKRKYF